MDIFNDEINLAIAAFCETNNISESRLECNVFPQTWGSTSVGYGGIGGCAMTTAPMSIP